MFKKIFKYKIISEETFKRYESREQLLERMIRDRVAEVASLTRERDRLEEELVELKRLPRGAPLVDITTADPSPTDTEQRKLYVAQVAGFFTEVLEPKLKQMIANTREAMDDVTNEREYDQAMKGASYALQELMRWGKAMVNEQVSNQIIEIDNQK